MDDLEREFVSLRDYRKGGIDMKGMKGWKTYVGCAIVAAGAVLNFLGLGGIAEVVMMCGGALGITGLGHKLDKLTK